MINSEQTISDSEFLTLRRLIGAEWIGVSGPAMMEADFSWKGIALHTDHAVVDMHLDERPVNIAGVEDDYPFLSISYKTTDGATMNSSGIYYLAKGQIIERLWVIRDEVTAFDNESPKFHNTADIGIVFALEKNWISITRTSHIMDAFAVSIADTQSGLDLPDSSEEWDTTLIDRYSFNRTWIELTK